MNKVAVIDYGMGNLHSVSKAVEFVAREAGLTVQVDVTDNPDLIRQADRVIFPGVGAIRDCMAEIRRHGIDGLVAEISQTKPVLAICVGFQALMEYSEENNGVACLGIARGRVRYFGDSLAEQDGERLKVPHMGWNCVKQTLDHPLWEGIADNSRFYFVHSYYIDADPSEQVAGITHYGLDFAAALSKGNIFAVQFHPEKSQDVGLRLLRNFLYWEGVQS
ncbi:MAG: imidazole glycerol phosphate synthase subunit HisH [Gammaproteobacteria bacterium]|jgi:glutamine amidotransferase